MGQGVLKLELPALSGSRFPLQWIASERRKRSAIPRAFWYCSIAGGAILLGYAVHRTDPVFVCGQALGVLIHARNLCFIHGRAAAVGETPA